MSEDLRAARQGCSPAPKTLPLMRGFKVLLIFSTPACTPSFMRSHSHSSVVILALPLVPCDGLCQLREGCTGPHPPQWKLLPLPSSSHPYPPHSPHPMMMEALVSSLNTEASSCLRAEGSHGRKGEVQSPSSESIYDQGSETAHYCNLGSWVRALKIHLPLRNLVQNPHL